jgi:hypothetical protein
MESFGPASSSKYATQRQWSRHSALYVGDELIDRGGRPREEALASFEELADRLLIEAQREAPSALPREPKRK